MNKFDLKCRYIFKDFDLKMYFYSFLNQFDKKYDFTTTLVKTLHNN